MRMSVSFTKQATLAPVIALIASAMLAACSEPAPPSQLQALGAPEPTSQVYFGAEYGPVQAALTTEPAAQPQAF